MNMEESNMEGLNQIEEIIKPKPRKTIRDVARKSKKLQEELDREKNEASKIVDSDLEQEKQGKNNEEIARKREQEEMVKNSNQVKILYTSKYEQFLMKNIGLNKDYVIERKYIQPIRTSKLAEIMNETEEKIQNFKKENPRNILYLQLLLDYDARYGTEKAKQYLNHEQEDSIDIEYNYLKETVKKSIKDRLIEIGQNIEGFFKRKTLKKLPFIGKKSEKKAEQQKRKTIELIEKDRSNLEDVELFKMRHEVANKDNRIERHAIKAQEKVEVVKPKENHKEESL